MQRSPPTDRRTAHKQPVRDDDHTRRPPSDSPPGPDASGSWREEYDRAFVPTPDEKPPPEGFDVPDPGTIVRDTGTDDVDDELLVVATHPTITAEQYRLEALGGTSVAEVNPEYDPEAPVVEGVYLNTAEGLLENADDALTAIQQAVEAGALTAYSFPADRLEAVETRGETA